MQEELNKLLNEAEVQHEKLVVLYAQANEQINKLQSEKEKVVQLLSATKGEIQSYKKVLEICAKSPNGEILFFANKKTNYYLGIMLNGSDGLYHLPVTVSPGAAC
jgi:hypothetical protein